MFSENLGLVCREERIKLFYSGIILSYREVWIKLVYFKITLLYWDGRVELQVEDKAGWKYLDILG